MTDDQSGSDRLGEKLKRLAALDLDRKIFGAFDHRYQLNEPADPRDVAAFEELFGVQLPGDYRAFLLLIANGGAGPGYGVFPFEEYESNEEQALDRLFPHRDDWDPEVAPFEGNPVDGSMRIGNMGCGIDVMLVVNGPEYGHIWEDHRESEGGIYPFLSGDPEQANARFTFTAWYEEWLDKSLGLLAGD